MSAAHRARWTYIGIGLVLLVGGVLLIGSAFLNKYVANKDVDSRGNADSSARSQWSSSGSKALTGAAPQEAAYKAGSCKPGGAPSSQYALVQFTGLPQYSYVGVAGDGTWDLLHTRSMVHYTGTPAPGQAGNSIIAFHREPNFEHIDQLGKGQTVTIQDRNCHTYVYTVTQTWDLNPDAVNQLVPTSGYQLTLITCTPFWQDYDRLVWRASLTSVDGKPFAPAA
jgi:LPXTG-site transpeptidase (sortase) family protein